MPCPQEPHSQWAASLRLAVLYGLRRSELLGLRWSTVNLKAGTLRIEQALVEVHSRRRVPRLRVIAGGVLIAGPLALRFRLLAGSTPAVPGLPE